MRKEEAGLPQARVRVTTTTRLCPSSPFLVLRGLHGTVIVFREGSRYKDSAKLWDTEEISEAELEVVLNAWGIPLTANPWDYVDPDALVAASHIPPSIRLPVELDEYITSPA